MISFSVSIDPLNRKCRGRCLHRPHSKPPYYGWIWEIRNILQRADEGHRPLRPPFSTDWGHPSRGVRLVRGLKSENEYDPAWLHNYPPTGGHKMYPSAGCICRRFFRRTIIPDMVLADTRGRVSLRSLTKFSACFGCRWWRNTHHSGCNQIPWCGWGFFWAIPQNPSLVGTPLLGCQFLS